MIVTDNINIVSQVTVVYRRIHLNKIYFLYVSCFMFTSYGYRLNEMPGAVVAIICIIM